MSELDTELRGLRDELNAAIPLPDFEHVTGRVRARRRLQLGAIAAVVVVAVAVPLLRATQSAPPATTNAADTTYVLDFADPDHGYALARTCTPGVSGCAFTLYRTADGGRTWAPRHLPPALDPKTGYFAATMYVLGPDAVAIDQPARDHLDRMTSSDGGRTWQRSRQPGGGSESAPLPRGALMTSRCGVPVVRTNRCLEIGTIEPATGRFVRTPTQPPLVPMQFGPAATPSGAYWVVGQNATTDRYEIAVTADGGGTWSVSDLSASWSAGPPDWSVVENDGVMYVLADSRVWTSTDDGRTWTFASARSGVAGSPIAARDGSLLVSDGASTWKSTDRGRTFVESDEKPFGVIWTRGGYLSLAPFALSGDGLHWREFSVR